MRALSICGASFTLLMMVGTLADQAQGAVRKCLPAVRAEGTDAASEAGARRKAIEGWLAAAAAQGNEFTRFALSAERKIDCRRIEAGPYVCSVSAMPCAVLQNPDLLPPEAYDRQTPAREPSIEKSR